MRYFLLTCALLFLAACSATPLPSPTSVPTATTIPQALIDEAAEFCPQPRNWVLYVTQSGDTLRSLAERTSGSTEQLRLANCLQNPGILRSGIVFYLPRRPIYP
jgi:spore germination protein YaaH